ncbi:alpha/beta hydrolase [Variovorax arabinosiphilus]|uniref:alpha/beta hydrolase n=1 Tax=Variovorax arabinosiphilus TaxID=3053498 RepID=UPI002577D68E|nr:MULTISPECIES: alpha/beta hydrolase [unclassified Variovorax]MDM0118992.1 alpha/beta hydrolase [Variovorax sp. J2L1-78]MDM0129418.1 alpha/beta hydrolase [Variovorax sp. J2L1-63]MDM0232796.1 alpha/beta hydrolase [Variovorax sp. J2R1-6]
MLTPKMASVVERMARAGHPPFHELTAAEAKASYEKGAGVLEVPKPALARVEDFHIAARDGFGLPARLYAPSADVLPVLVFFHGGGFTVGSIATHDTLCRVLASRSGCAVVSIDYRLAPEYKFPTASDDAWDAVQFVAREAASLGLDGSRVALGGDSAGGTLAAVCAVMARDAGIPVALQVLFYPGTTAHQDTPSHERFACGPLLDEPLISWFFGQYVRTPADRNDWRFAPLNADDVEGVAPAWIGLAEADPLIDEGVAYADKLRAAGVPVDLEIYRGVIHEFIKMGRAIPEALQAHADAARAMKEALKP